MADSKEQIFQSTIIEQLAAAGWRVGVAENYDVPSALYPEDVLGYVQETSPEAWKKFQKQNPADSEGALLRSVARALERDGTLSVLRHGYKDKGTRIRLCAFRPDHDLNPEALARYGANRLRVVQEVTYTREGSDARRIDLVLFVNGLPMATLELKSSFKQSVENAKKQYRLDRPPVDPKTKQAEPLLSFKRGALVHFALSQDEAWMTTRLSGKQTRFLPFNKGTEDGGAGNPLPADGSFPTSYLWRELFQPDNWLQVLGRYIHLERKEEEDASGRKPFRETMIFPRYHQWEVVRKLVGAVRTEGTGHTYLVQHSAGSGKSNSIAWTAHQLSALYEAEGKEQVFDSVIVVTDRTVLDDQLQETIYQFEHAEGVVRRIKRDEGDGSKSEKLAEALTGKARIIIVTIQTFPFVLDLIRGSATLKGRKYAVIADEAHSSQSGSSARQLKEVLTAEEIGAGEELSAEDVLRLSLEARNKSENISFFAFTATPKAKTIELFGRLPNPSLPPSSENKPAAFHVYSMRQAIEEEFILDVLKGYTSYEVACKLATEAGKDHKVEGKKGGRELRRWVRLHPHNISQKVAVVIEHYREHVQPLLGGKAKGMLVTSSRKEAVRYKLAFDRYVKEQGYGGIQAMVAFSGKVEDPENSASMPATFSPCFVSKICRTRWIWTEWK
jgi:type I restriction enzyme R subunit